MNSQRKTSMLLLAWAWAVSASGPAQASDLALDLSDLMAARELQAADVYQVVTVASPEGNAWGAGLVSSMQNGSISLKPLGSAGGIPIQALDVRFDASAAPAVTSNRAMEPQGSKWIVSSEDGNWELRVYDNPCQGSSSCGARFPSWALAVRRALGDGSMQGFPGVATLVDHKNGLSIVNALTGAEWISWPRAGYEHLGKLKTATFAGTDTLIATFDAGALTFDFAADRVVLTDNQGLAVGSGAIAGLGAMPFDRIVSAQSGESLGLPLFISDEMTVWRSGMVVGKAVAGQTLKPTPCAFVANDGQTGLCSEDGRIETYRRSVSEGGFAFEKESAGSGAGLTLVGGSTFAVGASGLYAVNSLSGAAQPTSLSFPSSEIILSGSGHAFVRDESSGSCRIVHLQQNAVLATSFKESGLSVPCSGILRGMAVAGNYASISVFDGHKVNIRWTAP